MCSRILSARAESAALEQAAAQSQSRSRLGANGSLKIVLVFLFVVLASEDDDADQDYRENSGDELDCALGHDLLLCV
jgi:hypothetical protein